MALSDRIVVMNRGVVVQADTPQQVYRFPSDKFVADFVGMPPMNIIPVTLRPQGHRVDCVTTGGHIAGRLVTEEPLESMEGHLGVRPAHMRWAPQPDDDAYWIPATVRQVEGTGEDTLIYTVADGATAAVLERGPRVPEAGDDIWIAFPPDSAHLFIEGKRKPLDRSAMGLEPLAAAQTTDSSR